MPEDQAIRELRRQVSRTRAWRLFFLILTPVGFILPCGLAIELAPPSDRPAPEGITPSQILGMLALGLPLIGVAGWVLMHSDVKKKTQELAQAEQAGLAS